MKAIRKLAAVAVIATCFAPMVQAETSVENTLKYREEVMDILKHHFSALAMIVTGKVEHTDHLQAHANALADAGKQVAVLFPENTKGADDSDALPAIWEKPDEFAEAVKLAEASLADLAAAAETGDQGAIMKAFAAAGKGCKGCHEGFRAEDD